MIHVTVVTNWNLLAQVTEKSRSMSFRHSWIQVLKYYYQSTASLSYTSMTVNSMPLQDLPCLVPLEYSFLYPQQKRQHRIWSHAHPRKSLWS